MMRVLRDFVDAILNRNKPQPAPIVIYKTRTQLIESGQGAYVRRHCARVISKPKE